MVVGVVGISGSGGDAGPPVVVVVVSVVSQTHHFRFLFLQHVQVRGRRCRRRPDGPRRRDGGTGSGPPRVVRDPVGAVAERAVLSILTLGVRVLAVRAAIRALVAGPTDGIFQHALQLAHVDSSRRARERRRRVDRRGRA